MDHGHNAQYGWMNEVEFRWRAHKPHQSLASWERTGPLSALLQVEQLVARSRARYDAIMIIRRPRKYDKPGVARITIIIFHLCLTDRIITSHQLYRPLPLLKGRCCSSSTCRRPDFVLPASQNARYVFLRPSSYIWMIYKRVGERDRR